MSFDFSKEFNELNQEPGFCKSEVQNLKNKMNLKIITHNKFLNN